MIVAGPAVCASLVSLRFMCSCGAARTSALGPARRLCGHHFCRVWTYRKGDKPMMGAVSYNAFCFIAPCWALLQVTR